MCIYKASSNRHDTSRRRNSRISTPAPSASGRGAAAGKKRSDSQRKALPARLVDRACLYAAPPHARYEVKNQTLRRTDPNRRVKYQQPATRGAAEILKRGFRLGCGCWRGEITSLKRRTSVSILCKGRKGEVRGWSGAQCDRSCAERAGEGDERGGTLL